MPKKKKAKKKTGGRRKGRVGGIGKADMSMAAGVAGGIIATRLLNKFAVKQFPKADSKLIAAAPAILGAVIAWNPMKMRILNSPLVKGAAYGMVGAGVTSLGTELGILGASSAPIVLRRRVAGPGEVPVIGQGNPNLVPWVGAASNSPGNPARVPVIGRMGYRRRAQAAM